MLVSRFHLLRLAKFELGFQRKLVRLVPSDGDMQEVPDLSGR